MDGVAFRYAGDYGGSDGPRYRRFRLSPNVGPGRGSSMFVGVFLRGYVHVLCAIVRRAYVFMFYSCRFCRSIYALKRVPYHLRRLVRYLLVRYFYRRSSCTRGHRRVVSSSHIRYRFSWRDGPS